MKFNISKKLPFIQSKEYFCPEPWVGIFSIETNLDVTFCPCFLKMKIGNLNEGSIQEIWNSEKLQALRESFQKGELPKECQHQLCSVALNK